jgi:hypothetical protein
MQPYVYNAYTYICCSPDYCPGWFASYRTHTHSKSNMCVCTHHKNSSNSATTYALGDATDAQDRPFKPLFHHPSPNHYFIIHLPFPSPNEAARMPTHFPLVFFGTEFAAIIFLRREHLCCTAAHTHRICERIYVYVYIYIYIYVYIYEDQAISIRNASLHCLQKSQSKSTSSRPSTN